MTRCVCRGPPKPSLLTEVCQLCANPSAQPAYFPVSGHATCSAKLISPCSLPKTSPHQALGIDKPDVRDHRRGRPGWVQTWVQTGADDRNAMERSARGGGRKHRIRGGLQLHATICEQAEGTAKPPFPGSNPGGASIGRVSGRLWHRPASVLAAHFIRGIGSNLGGRLSRSPWASGQAAARLQPSSLVALATSGRIHSVLTAHGRSPHRIDPGD